MMNIPELSDWLKDILSRDAMTFENAYHGPRPPASIAVPQILSLLEKHNDDYTRGKLIELLGESNDKTLIPIL
jgi:hypothetical protein